jgi:hypothetical protein
MTKLLSIILALSVVGTQVPRAELTTPDVTQVDALDRLINFRTAEWGEKCTRYPAGAVCTLGSFRRMLVSNPDPSNTVMPPTQLASELCEKFNMPGFELFDASFAKHEGEVILNCVYRNDVANKPW